MGYKPLFVSPWNLKKYPQMHKLGRWISFFFHYILEEHNTGQHAVHALPASLSTNGPLFAWLIALEQQKKERPETKFLWAFFPPHIQRTQNA